jgi:hypothetical protein
MKGIFWVETFSQLTAVIDANGVGKPDILMSKRVK